MIHDGCQRSAARSESFIASLKWQMVYRLRTTYLTAHTLIDADSQPPRDHRVPVLRKRILHHTVRALRDVHGARACGALRVAACGVGQCRAEGAAQLSIRDGRDRPPRNGLRMGATVSGHARVT